MTKSTFRIHIRIHHQDKSNMERVKTKVKYWRWVKRVRSPQFYLNPQSLQKTEFFPDIPSVQGCNLCCQISVVIGYWRCNRRNHSIEMTKSTFRIHIRIHHQDKSNVERVRTQVKYWSWSEGLKSAAETRVCQVEKYLIILFGAWKNYSLHLFSRKEQFISLSFYF